ncbi:MAG TPA: hypothetical protein VFB59_00990 [Candidatus Saccharimonadales bacterium]|nr:hypothetical protein [Candidatus Saccharimonadales bacterium]
MQQPTAMVFSVLADNFAQTEAARKLVIDTEQAHEKAVQENVLTLPDGLRVIGSASIASLLDTTPQTVNNWIERHESVEPYELPQVFDKYAPNKPLIHEEDFRKIYRWFVPALVPNPPLSYGQLPENNPTQQMGQDYF